MKINLYKTKRKELPIIAQIYLEEFSKPPYNESWTKNKAMIKMKDFYKRFDLFSIELGGIIVGFIVINPNFMYPGEVAFGEEFAIKSKFQRKGIGTEVLKRIFKIYREKGYKRFMGIAELKSNAFKLYKKLDILPSKKDILIEKELK